MANEQVMGTVSISYVPAIEAAKQFSLTLEQLNAQLRNHQSLARQTGAVTAAGMAGQFQNQKIIFDQYGRTLVDLGQKAPAAAKGVDTLTQAASKQTETVQRLANSQTFLQHRMGWFLSGSVFYGAISGAQAAAAAMSDVEMGMVQISRVTEDATADFNQMRAELLQLGIAYGQGWENVQDIALRWAQAGYGVSDTLELTKDSLLALNTAELDAQYATQGFIAIMAQWGLTSEQLLPTIDKINKVADDFAITSQDLVDGLNRSSGAARVLGLTLDETIAILTVMREATGRTGREVGNALNSILSFMQRPIAIEAFETQGIQVWADEAQTQFRNVIEIFDEVAARWPQMSEATQNMFVQAADEAGLYSEELADLAGVQQEFNDAQQRDVSQAMAGIYRRNYLLALLQNWSKIDSVLIAQEDSLGYSLQENARTMDTLQKKVESLKTAFTMLAVEIGDAGLLDVMKSAVDTTTGWVEAFEELPPVIRNLLIVLGEMATILGVLNLTAKTFFSVEIGQSIASMTAAARAATTATGALAALSTAGKGLMAAFGGPYMIAALAATAAVSTLVRSVQDSRDAMERTAIQVSDLYAEYEQLASSSDSLDTKYASMRDRLDSIADVAPELVEQYDAMGHVISLNNDALQQYLSLSEQARSSSQSDLDSMEETISKVTETVAGYQNEINELERQKQLLPELVMRRNEVSAALERETLTSEEAQTQKRYLGDLENAIIGIVGEEGLQRLKLAGFTEQAVAIQIAALERLISAQRRASISALSEEQTRLRAQRTAAEQEIKTSQATQESLMRLSNPPTLPKGGGVLDWLGFIGQSTAYSGAAQTGVTLQYRQMIEKEKADADRAKADLRRIERDEADLQKRLNEVIMGPTPSPESLLSEDYSQFGTRTQAYNKLNEERQRLNHQLQIGQISEAEYLSGLQRIEAQMRASGVEEQKIWDIQEEIYKLRTKAAETMADQLTPFQAALKDFEYFSQFDMPLEQQLAQLRQLQSGFRMTKDEARDLTLRIYRTEQQLAEERARAAEQQTRAIEEQARAVADGYDDMYASAMGYYDHAVNLSRMSRDDQIRYLRDVTTVHAWETEKQWSLDEQLFRLYQDELQSQNDSIDRAYQDRIDRIDREAQRTIDAIQEQIDALDTKSEINEREDAERQHNQTITDLQEQLRYHQLRTGKEHAEALADIEQQIAEESIRWQQQQDAWRIDDRKRSLQDQIDAVESAAEEEKRIWKQKYDDIKAQWDEWSINFASAAVNDPKWLEIGQDIGQQIVDGFSGSIRQMDSILSTAGSKAGMARGSIPATQTPTGVVTSGYDPALNSILELKDQWDEGNETGNAALKKNAAEEAQKYYEQLPPALADEVSRMDNDALRAYLGKAHTGAYVLESGAAELLKGERVLSPQLTVRFDRLTDALARIQQPTSLGFFPDLDRAADRIVAAIERRSGVQIDTLFRAENVQLEDDQDMEIFSRELARGVQIIAGRA